MFKNCIGCKERKELIEREIFTCHDFCKIYNKDKAKKKRGRRNKKKGYRGRVYSI